MSAEALHKDLRSRASHPASLTPLLSFVFVVTGRHAIAKSMLVVGSGAAAGAAPGAGVASGFASPPAAGRAGPGGAASSTKGSVRQVLGFGDGAVVFTPQCYQDAVTALAVRVCVSRVSFVVGEALWGKSCGGRGVGGWGWGWG